MNDKFGIPIYIPAAGSWWGQPDSSEQKVEQSGELVDTLGYNAGLRAAKEAFELGRADYRRDNGKCLFKDDTLLYLWERGWLNGQHMALIEKDES